MVNKTLLIKLNIEQQVHHYNWSVTSGSPEGRVVAAPLMAIIVLLC